MAAFEPTVYAERRATLDERMRQQDVDVLFCPPSGRSRVPHRSATPLPDVRQHLLHPRLGVRRLLPARPRPGVRAPPDGRRVRHAHRGARRVRRRQRDRRRVDDVRRPRRRLRSARHDRRRAAHLGGDGPRPRTGERRQDRQWRLVDEPDATDQVAGRDRADDGRLPHRRLGDGGRHRRHRRRRRRARARRGARQPAPPRRLARRLLRHRRVGDGPVDGSRRVRSGDQRANAARQRRVLRLRGGDRRVLLGLRADGGDRRDERGVRRRSTTP